MWPYLIPVILTIACIAVYDSGRTERYKTVAFIGIGAYLVLLYGLRYMVGYDTYYMYNPVYAEFPTFSTYMKADHSSFSTFAPGFRLIFLVFKSLGSPYWGVQLFISLCINLMFLVFIKRRVKAQFTALLLYMVCVSIYYNAEILRQSLAIGIFLMSFEAISRRRWVVYYLYVLCAWMFHTSAVVLLFVPLLYVLHIKMDLKIFAYIALMSLVYVAIYYSLNCVMLLFDEPYSEKIAEYTWAYNDRFNIRYFIYHISLITVIPALALGYFKFELKREIPFEPLVCGMFLIAPGVIQFGEAFLRLSAFFVPFFLFSAASCIGDNWKSGVDAVHKYVAAAILVFIMGCYLHQTVKSCRIGWEYYPYRNVIFNDGTFVPEMKQEQ